MRLCWVTNEKLYSRMFRSWFNSETSHVGAMFSFDGLTFATDLNRPVGSVYGEKYWLSKYNIVWSMNIALPKASEIAMFKVCREYCECRTYDMGAYYYGMLCGLKYKLFNTPLPKFNKWSKHTGSTCQEILTPILQSPIFREIVPQASAVDVTKFTTYTTDMTMNLMQSITHKNSAVEWVFNG